MYTEQKNRIVLEWFRWYHETEEEDRSDRTIIEWWLEKLRSRDADLVKEIEALPVEFPIRESDEYDEGHAHMKSIIISLIQNK